MTPRENELQARRRHLEQPRASERPSGPVLVVDHNPDRRAVAERLVSDIGYTAHGVGSGQQALDALESATYLAMLLDIDLPVMDGFETARLLRHGPAPGRYTPIVAVVAHPSTEVRERCAAAGIEKLMFRPLDSQLLEVSLADVTRMAIPAEGTPPVAPAESEHPVIDTSRLDDLAELVSADGTSLLVSMVASYLRRSPERAEALQQAIAADDRDAVIAIAHDLKGASGTIGADRVMRCASAIEHHARSGSMPTLDSTADLLAEMDAAVEELSSLALLQAVERSDSTRQPIV
jgi:CheY-like chemotaxis protein